MTDQEIFNKVVAHLLQMEKRAMVGSLCAYLTDDGNRCAVGCLIPDGHKALNSVGTVRTLLSDHPDLGEVWGIDVNFVLDDWNAEKLDVTPTILLLDDLQQVHDSPDHWGPAGLNGEGLRQLVGVGVQNCLVSPDDLERRLAAVEAVEVRA